MSGRACEPLAVSNCDARCFAHSALDCRLGLDDPRVKLARQTLFGAWEMNWIAFNTAGDTKLAPETAKALGHFMYPYAEGTKGALDYYDPQNFQYRMSAREVKV